MQVGVISRARRGTHLEPRVSKAPLCKFYTKGTCMRAYNNSGPGACLARLTNFSRCELAHSSSAWLACCIVVAGRAQTGQIFSHSVECLACVLHILRRPHADLS